MNKYSVLKAGALAAAGAAGFWLGEMRGAKTATDQTPPSPRNLITVTRSDGKEIASVPNYLSEEGATVVCVPSEIPAYDEKCGSKVEGFGSSDQKQVFKALQIMAWSYGSRPATTLDP